MKNILQKTILNTFLFRIMFLIHAFIYIFPYTINYAERSIKIFLLWGLFLISYDLLIRKNLLKNKLNYYLYFFVLFSLVSVIVNYNKFSNLKMFLYLLIQVIVPFSFNMSQKLKSTIKEITIFSSIIVIITLIVSSASLVIFLQDFKGSVLVNNSEYLFGMNEGRLYGIMGNPNSTALIAYISIMVSMIIFNIFYYVKFKYCTLIKGVLVINILIQLFILFLGNSRSTIITTSVAVAIILIYYYIITFKHKIKHKSVNIVACMLIFIISFPGIMGIAKISNTMGSYLPGMVKYVEYEIKDYVTQESIKDNVETADQDKQVEIEKVNSTREYATDDNSNGRFSIWKIGFKIAKENPLFGVGSNNIQKAAIIAEPNFEYIAILGNMHNIYLQILTGSGVFALLFFLIYLLRYFITSIKSLLITNLYVNKINIVIFSLLISLCIENLFDSNILYFMCLFIVPIFWSYLSYSIYLNQYKDEV